MLFPQNVCHENGVSMSLNDAEASVLTAKVILNDNNKRKIYQRFLIHECMLKELTKLLCPGYWPVHSIFLSLRVLHVC